MNIYTEVNDRLRGSAYRPKMAEKRRKPGSPKGVLKPQSRLLDAGFKARLGKAWLNRPGLTVPQLAGEIGCTRAVLLNYLKPGKKSADALLILDIADALRVSVRWLLTEKGHIGAADGLSPDDVRVLNTFHQLNEDNRDFWISQGEELHRRQPTLLATAVNPYPAKPPIGPQHAAGKT